MTTTDREIELLLARRNAQFETLLNAAPMGVYFVDKNLRIQEANPAAVAMFDVGELTGRDLAEVCSSIWSAKYVQEVIGRFRVTLETGEPYVASTALNYRRDRDARAYYDWRLTRIPLDEDFGVVCYFREVSSEVQALQSTLAELQNLAYVVSHELQEPLQTIKSYQNLLAVRYRGRLGDDADEFIEKCANAAEHTQRMIDDLWEYARVNQSEIGGTRVDSNRALGKAIDTLQNELKDSGASLEYGMLPHVRANEKLLVNLFTRLLGNAIKFRRDTEPLRISIRADQVDDAWQFAVEDTGQGIDAMTSKDVFKLFFRGDRRPSKEGIGMGLPIAKKIVEHHGGRIWVETKVGTGSTFYFTVPDTTLTDFSR